MLGRGSGGDKGRGLVPIHVGSRHLIRVLEAEARKLERAPLNRQVIVATTRNYLGSRLKMDAHRSSLRPSPRERIGGMPALISHALLAYYEARKLNHLLDSLLDRLPRRAPRPRDASRAPVSRRTRQRPPPVGPRARDQLSRTGPGGAPAGPCPFPVRVSHVCVALDDATKQAS